MDTVVDIISAFVVLFLVLQFAQWFYGGIYRRALERERADWLALAQGELPQIEHPAELPSGGAGSAEWLERRRANRKADHADFDEKYEEYKNPDIERAIRMAKQAEELENLKVLMAAADGERKQAALIASRTLMQLRRQEQMYRLGYETRWNRDGTNDDDLY